MHVPVFSSLCSLSPAYLITYTFQCIDITWERKSRESIESFVVENNAHCIQAHSQVIHFQVLSMNRVSMWITFAREKMKSHHRSKGEHVLLLSIREMFLVSTLLSQKLSLLSLRLWVKSSLIESETHTHEHTADSTVHCSWRKDIRETCLLQCNQHE